MSGPELPVILRTYDLVLWSCNHLVKYPRIHRFTLGDRLERNLYEILDALIEAKFRKDRRETLIRVGSGRQVLPPPRPGR